VPGRRFKQFAERVPDLSLDDILAAASHAKLIGSELRALAHRLAQAEADERRRNESRR
jgi:hypothetical protein